MTNAIQPNTRWVDPEDPTEELQVDFVHPLGTAYYHWRTPVDGQTVYGYRRLDAWPFVVKLADHHLDVLSAIAEGPPLGRTNLWKALGEPGSKSTFAGWVDQLIDRGLVHPPKRGAGAGETGLRATDDGLAYLAAFERAAA